jgi:undecaprenyl diphosphate synthase
MATMLQAPGAAAAAVPRHVAIIMDGNRRWARAHRRPPIEGHRRGARTLRAITRAAYDAGIEVLTVYAFSEENWHRDQAEVGLLLELCSYFAKKELEPLRRENVRVRVLGNIAGLPAAPRTALEELIAGTRENSGLILNLAINYSARAEMTEAIRALALDVAGGNLDPARIDEPLISSYLYTRGLPDPDLLIRTGGELRLSNFLLYQVAYTELWSTGTYWPEFTAAEFAGALAEYAKRQRRFGT